MNDFQRGQTAPKQGGKKKIKIMPWLSCQYLQLGSSHPQILLFIAACVPHTHSFSELHMPSSGLGRTGKNTGINYLQKISGGRREGEENMQIREREKSILQISHHQKCTFPHSTETLGLLLTEGKTSRKYFQSKITIKNITKGSESFKSV